MTTTSRRNFLTAAAGVGLGGYFTGFTGGLRVLGAEPDDATTKKNPSASMVVETVFTEGLAQLSYLIGDKATGKAVVIDPRRDVDVYIELARKHKLSITHAIETHIHADLVPGCRELADRTGTARLFADSVGRHPVLDQPVRTGANCSIDTLAAQITVTVSRSFEDSFPHDTMRLSGAVTGSKLWRLKSGWPWNRLLSLFHARPARVSLDRSLCHRGRPKHRGLCVPCIAIKSRSLRPPRRI